MTSFRLDQGGLIDRNAPLNFRFDGKAYQGFQGDTLASALLANGIQLMGRSFKYHRPRGVYGSGSEEPNALMTVGRGQEQESNLRATMIDLYEGLEAQSQNAWPSLKTDVMAVNSLISAFLPAGFYYKIFLGSANFWLLPEYFIRRAAGLGRPNEQANEDDYQHHFTHCDVLVVGSGISGVAAALAAARSGASVTLVDEHDKLGGQGLWREAEQRAWLHAALAELADYPKVRLMSRTTAWGHYDDNMVACVQIEGDPGAPLRAHQPRARAWHIRAKRVIYATGAIERPLVFANNDRPGAMLAHAGAAFAGKFGVLVGKSLVLATNNDDGYNSARLLADAGAQVHLLDAREQVSEALQDSLKGRDVELSLGQTLLAAKGGAGGVSAAEIGGLDGKSSRLVTCDGVLSSGGWSPAIHLHSHTGGKATWRDDLQAFVAGKRLQEGVTVGAAAGLFGTQEALASGWQQGITAAQDLGHSSSAGQTPTLDGLDIEATPIMPLWSNPKPTKVKGKAFVDFQNDAGSSDVVMANQEGYRSVEHLKRYTTLGMGTDQGKTANINGHALLAQAQGRAIAEVGTTTFRPPYSPLTLGAFGGPHVGEAFAPIRRTPMHDLHAAAGASFVEAGMWKRAEWYTRDGEDMWASIKREARQVRQAVAMCDVSTLGKIDVQGPDAQEFIQRLYCNGMKTLAIGKVRYGLMLRDDGFVFDDGTVARLAENHYYMTTTTANAAAVLAHMEYHLDVVWPDLKVRVASITDQWAGMAIAGPRSRDMLQAALPHIDMSSEGLPFMGFVDTELNGLPVRVLRISFSGELAYEVHTPARFGPQVWQALSETGKDFGLMPYGTEALGALRIEKGHVAGGELDGRTTPADMGLGKMVAKKKDFIGRLGLLRDGVKRQDRASLVGIMPADGRSRIIAGSQLTEEGQVAGFGNVTRALGWISSAHFSVEHDCFIALGFVENGAERIGQTLFAASPLDGEHLPVNIVSSHMIDPQGERQNG